MGNPRKWVTRILKLKKISREYKGKLRLRLKSCSVKKSKVVGRNVKLAKTATQTK